LFSIHILKQKTQATYFFFDSFCASIIHVGEFVFSHDSYSFICVINYIHIDRRRPQWKCYSFVSVPNFDSSSSCTRNAKRKRYRLSFE
jgi:hypothetical protein